jgi:uncharacterized protein
MSLQLSLWIVLGGLALMIAALFVTILARGMEKKAPASSHTDAEALAAILPNGLFSSTFRKHVLGLDGEFDAKKAEETAKATAKTAARKGGAIASVAIVLALSGAAFGIVTDLLEDNGLDAIPESREIAAGELHGTLISPRKNAPVVLIVPGSGPTDRDGNNPLGVQAQPYKLLAEALFADGIATVRVDKRGMFGSAAAGDPNAVTIAAYAEDYRAWIDAIRAETGRKCVFLLGHSEGALMVSAAAEGRKDVCGLILVSGIGRKLGDVLREQLRANPANAPVLDQALAAIAELEAGRHVDISTMHPALTPLFASEVQDFLISEMAADPVDLLRKARTQALIIQGSTDIQVGMEDARLLNKAPRTRLEIIDGMNHVLKEAPADPVANLATYANADLPLAEGLVREIRRFVRRED